MRVDKRLLIAGVLIACVLVALGAHFLFSKSSSQEQSGATSGAHVNVANGGSVDITDAQKQYVKVVKAAEHAFEVRRDAVGFIDFNQERLVPISPPYPGRILETFAKAGDDVGPGKPLFTIESPDLIQAEATLIAAAGTLEVTSRALERAKSLYPVQAVPQRELEQAVAEQQAAEAALRAGRDAVRIFGKSDAQIDRMIAERHVDPQMAVLSPMRGRVVARNASPGMLAQPGATPPPYLLADISTVWLEANIPEADLALIHAGQEVIASVGAYPGRTFTARISNVGESVDPSTHRIAVRAEISDPKHELRPQMLASIVIRTGTASRAPAVPLAGVVREGDGTMSIWVTSDGRHFTRRTVQIGLSQDGLDEVTSGLSVGEQVAGDGALFLSNALALANP